MSAYTKTFMSMETGSRPQLDPRTADVLTADSRLLSDLSHREPGIVRGPLMTRRQHWTRTGRHLCSPHIAPSPSTEAHFAAPSSRFINGPEVKPSHGGLYTSTVTSCGYSMWRALLGPHGSSLYPLPWYTWNLTVTRRITVVEIDSAACWVDFVSSYPHVSDGSVYPDWPRISKEFDGVHITLPLIAAAQGFSFHTSCGTIPPAFWDVETTFWLRWCFSRADLVEAVPA